MKIEDGFCKPTSELEEQLLDYLAEKRKYREYVMGYNKPIPEEVHWQRQRVYNQVRSDIMDFFQERAKTQKGDGNEE